MLDLDGAECPEAGIAYGFKINDFAPRRGFPSILEAARARDRHREAHWLIQSFTHAGYIPSSFDERLPEEAFARPTNARLRIGEIISCLTKGAVKCPASSPRQLFCRTRNVCMASINWRAADRPSTPS
jgi:hypothetical protein